MRKYLLVFFIVALVAYLLYYISESFSPGSYGNAETYELNVDETELIELIERFKEDNPQFKVPTQTQLSDHKNDHWYVIYFYYPEENEIIYTWTRPSGKGATTWALVSVNNGQMDGGWRDINKGLNSAENKVQINRFENLILEKVKEKIGR